MTRLRLPPGTATVADPAHQTRHAIARATMSHAGASRRTTTDMTDLRDLDDRQLLAQTGGLARDALAVFYRRHVNTVVRYCARRGLTAHQAADATADTFAAVVAHRRKYRPRDGPAQAWLLGIAAHKIADQARADARRQRTQEKLGLERIDLTQADLDDYQHILRQEQDALKALDDLPAHQRDAVHAHVVDEQDYRTVARRMGITETAARQRVHRALQTLRMRVAHPDTEDTP